MVKTEERRQATDKILSKYKANKHKEYHTETQYC